MIAVPMFIVHGLTNIKSKQKKGATVTSTVTWCLKVEEAKELMPNSKSITSGRLFPRFSKPMLVTVEILRRIPL